MSHNEFIPGLRGLLAFSAPQPIHKPTTDKVLRRSSICVFWDRLWIKMPYPLRAFSDLSPSRTRAAVLNLCQEPQLMELFRYSIPMLYWAAKVVQGKGLLRWIFPVVGICVELQ